MTTTLNAYQAPEHQPLLWRGRNAAAIMQQFVLHATLASDAKAAE